MKRHYSKIILCICFLASLIVLIIGAIKSIDGMIIGGVLGLISSALVVTGLMIHNTTTPKETVKVISVGNPLPDV
jgi:hypothetical protein